MPKPDVAFDERLARVQAHFLPLQRDLRSALHAILPGGSGARSASRALGISRGLAWGCWNLATGPDLPAALRALPGAKGWTLIFDAFERRGYPAATLGSLRRSVEALEREMRLGRVAPSMLRSMAAGGLDSAAETRRMQAARRRAREAAEVLYSVRAQACLGGLIAGPPDRRGMVDLAGVSLFDGLERLRPGPAWPIFEGLLLSRDDQPRSLPLARGAIPGVLEEFCSPGSVGTELRPSGSQHHLVSYVARIDVRQKPIRAAFGLLTKSAGSVTQPKRPHRERSVASPHLGLIATVPVPIAVFDMLLHRDIPIQGDPVGALYGPPDPWPMDGGGHGEPDRLEAKRLSLDASVTRPRTLAPPALVAALATTWERMLRLGIAAFDRPLDEFRHFRLVLRDPPMHGRLMMRWTAV